MREPCSRLRIVCGTKEKIDIRLKGVVMERLGASVCEDHDIQFAIRLHDRNLSLKISVMPRSAPSDYPLLSPFNSAPRIDSPKMPCDFKVTQLKQSLKTPMASYEPLGGLC